MASSSSSVDQSVGETSTSQVDEQVDQLRELAQTIGARGMGLMRKASSALVEVSQGVVSAVTGEPPTPVVVQQGTFSLVKPGLLGGTKEPRSWMLICGRGKESLLGGGSSVVYELQSTDAKGKHERIMLQATDAVKDLNPEKYECTLVSMADGDEVLRRFRFADKDDFTRWTHAIMDAIRNSQRRTKQGTMLHLFKKAESRDGRKISADL